MSEQVEDLPTKVLRATHRKGNTLEDTVRAYDEWARSYEADVNPSNYSGSTKAAEVLSDYYSLSVRKYVKILDVGAGTGTIGEFLTKHYFKNIDALEPSEKMLEILKEKKVYGNIWHDSIGYHQTEIPNDFYDCIVTSGAFGEGHIPVSSLHEFIRVVKPGGMFCIIIREENLTNSPEYAKLEPLLDDLEKENKIVKISRTVFKRFWYYLNGVSFVYKVL